MATSLNPSYHLHLAAARKRQRDQYIQQGSTHKDAVRQVQARLSDLGYEISTDGAFGPETLKAVREFQRQHGLKADGIVGRRTLARLKDAKRKEANPSDPGLDAVTAVVDPKLVDTKKLGRAKARQHGGDSAARGKTGGAGLDPSSPDSIKAFQRQHGLVADGVIGPKTQEALRSAGPGSGGSRAGSSKRSSTKGTGDTKTGPHGGTVDPVTGAERASSSTGPIGSTKVAKPKAMTFEPGGRGAKAGSMRQPQQPQQPQDNNPEFNKLHPRSEGGKFAKKGDSGQQVTNTQEALNRVDQAGLKTDGQFGSKTDGAVRKYQQHAGLTVDGIVGPKTSASLRRRLRLVRRLNRTPGQALAPR